jgi:hypothetical protein
MARPLRDRLIFELNQIRDELRDTVAPIPTAELDYVPHEGMKGYRAQLIEIGAMLAESVVFLTTGKVPEWKDCEARVKGNTAAELLASLDSHGSELLHYLESSSDEDLLEVLPIPADWEWCFGTGLIEREELVRWVARHEYYHLGQIIAFRWSQGHNPYKKKD